MAINPQVGDFVKIIYVNKETDTTFGLGVISNVFFARDIDGYSEGCICTVEYVRSNGRKDSIDFDMVNKPYGVPHKDGVRDWSEEDELLTLEKISLNEVA